MAINLEEKTLQCKGCLKWLSLSCFSVDNNSYRGYQSKCKDCHRAYYKANREKYAARNKAFREANPKEVRIYAVQYHIENRDKILAYHAEHKHNNPELGRQAQHRRRARMYDNGPVEYFKTKEIYERDHGICGICKEPVSLEEATLDHVIPLSRGGTHTRDNVQVAHDPCNKRKWQKLPEELEAESKWL